jgi:hypothetical protein
MRFDSKSHNSQIFHLRSSKCDVSDMFRQVKFGM